MQQKHLPLVSRQHDYPIEIIGPMKRHRRNILPHVERARVNRQLKDAVVDGLICLNHSKFGSPILFVRKADGSLLLCIYYRGQNEVTFKDAYPLSRVDDTLDELKDASFYTHLDLASCLWQVRVRDEDIHKTAFNTPYGMMEWDAMPLGMCNTLAKFHRMMNDIMCDFLHKLVTVYPDDVYVHCRTRGEHMEHMRLVLQLLRRRG
jgi:hypothetical protein